MDDAQFHNFTHTLQTTLASDERVLALVAIGSLAHSERVDRWSDHDFWVVTTAEAQMDFLSNLSWLPDHTEIALALRPAQQYYTVLYSFGHIAEFAVFGLHDLSRGRLTDYHMLFDKQDVTARLKATVAQVQEEQHNGYNATAAFGHFLVTLCTGVSRAARGERLSAQAYIFHYAIDELVTLITHHIPAQRSDQADSFNSLRRFEQRYPDLSAKLIRLLILPPSAAARQLLNLAEELFMNTAFIANPQALETTRALIASTEQVA